MLNLWSHLIESSSAVWSTRIPPGNFVNGHSLTICDIVCLSPHAQNGSSRMPQSYRVAAQRPWPVHYRLRSWNIRSVGPTAWWPEGSGVALWLHKWLRSWWMQSAGGIFQVEGVVTIERNAVPCTASLVMPDYKDKASSIIIYSRQNG